jgi:hypothetical protein
MWELGPLSVVIDSRLAVLSTVGLAWVTSWSLVNRSCEVSQEENMSTRCISIGLVVTEANHELQMAIGDADSVH